jgi:energy-coupling factor transporter ATP-binding protein EcfA2
MEADEIKRRMPAIIAGEVAAINRTFQGRELIARTRAALTVVAGRSYVSYELETGKGVLPQDVEKLLPKLTEALFRLRNQGGKTRHVVNLRLRYQPLALEINHPFPAPLDWHKAQTALDPHSMLTGRNYSGGEPTDDVLSFDDTPHVLIAGTTGSGKSTLLRMMIATLALNTDPDLLRLYLVDLKNEDLLPFRRLPHVETTAITRAQAMDVVRYMHAEKNRRVLEGKAQGPRVVLVVDELAQIADKSTLLLLDETLAVARSKRINAIFATQKPTVDVVGRLGKANLTTRLVGRVTTSDESTTAAGRGETGAHLLPGRGAFLRIEGADVTRLQAYWLDDAGTEAMVDAAVQRWGKRAVSSGYRGGEQVVRTGATTGEQVVRNGGEAPVTLVTPPIVAQEWGAWGENAPAIASPVSVPRLPVAVAARPAPELMPQTTYPLGRTRELTPAEVATVRRLKAEGLSGNAICERIFGPKNTQRLDIIRRALEGGAA